MKVLHILLVSALIYAASALMTGHYSSACLFNSDWPHAPCYAISGLHVTKEQMKKDWAGYYLYKGPQWMEAKRVEMSNAEAAGLLKAWECKNASNHDAWWYYYLNDQAPGVEEPMNGPLCAIPPLQQFKVGTKIGEIGCDYDRYLLVNKKNSMPSCVKITRIPRLLGLGWEHLATYLDNTVAHSPKITTISVTEQGFPSCKFCEGRSEDITVVVGTNNTVRWINSTPSPIWFYALPNGDDMAFYDSTLFPLRSHAMEMRFPAYLYGGQDFEYTFTKPGKFFWHTTPQFMGWVTVLQPSNTGGIANQTSAFSNQNSKPDNPFGIIALVIYRPPDVCLGPCPPNTFYLKTNSESTTYLLGYDICDGNLCTGKNDLSVLLPARDILRPDFKMIPLPEDLKWKYGDTVRIQLYVSQVNDSKTAVWTDLGNSMIVP